MTQWYNKVTGELTSEKPGGGHYYDPDVFKERFSEWEEKDDSFRPPVDAAKEKAEKLADLSKTFATQLQDLQGKVCISDVVNNDSAAVANLKAQIATLKTDYIKNRSVVLNG